MWWRSDSLNWSEILHKLESLFSAWLTRVCQFAVIVFLRNLSVIQRPCQRIKLSLGDVITTTYKVWTPEFEDVIFIWHWPKFTWNVDVWLAGIVQCSSLRRIFVVYYFTRLKHSICIYWLKRGRSFLVWRLKPCGRAINLDSLCLPAYWLLTSVSAMCLSNMKFIL